MNWEKACGAVVFTRNEGEIRYLIVSNLRGIYGFPKGHVEAGETAVQTALREVYEETHAHIRLVEGFVTEDVRDVYGKENTKKHITYFLGEAENPQELSFQKEELTGMEWMNFHQAMECFQFESSRRILRQADKFLRNYLSL